MPNFSGIINPYLTAPNAALLHLLSDAHYFESTSEQYSRWSCFGCFVSLGDKAHNDHTLLSRNYFHTEVSISRVAHQPAPKYPLSSRALEHVARRHRKHPNHPLSIWYESRNHRLNVYEPSFAICKYTCVDEISECPSIICTSLRSLPLCTRCAANECLSV